MKQLHKKNNKLYKKVNDKVNFIKSSKKVDLLNELVNTQIARKN